MAPSSALPIGASRAIGEKQPVRLDPEQSGLLNSVLALLPPPPPDTDFTDEELVAQEVVGFIIM